LEKATVKNFGVFLKLINLTAVICILSSIANTARTKGDDPITLLNTTITKVETGSVPVLNESGITSESELPENTTNKQPDNSQSNAEQPGEWESIRMRITAYCPCPKCCGQYSDGITACGHEIQPGDTFVAADRRYPFGTEMVIPGYSNSQPVQVLDRGGTIKGNRLDVFFATHQEALEWGVKYLDVKVRRK
jgi:3D (Asp-Asp-Asp) domain-containing protein